MGLIKGAKQLIEKAVKPQEFSVEDDEYYPAVEGDNSRWELETEEQLVNIEQTLRGKKKAVDGKSWIPIVRGDNFKPLMNEFGIASLLGTLRMCFQKHNALGHIDKFYLNIAIIDIMDVIIDSLALNRVKWDIDKKSLDTIRIMVEHQVYIFLTRSVDGHEKSYRKKRYPMRESYSHDEVSPSEIQTL